MNLATLYAQVTVALLYDLRVRGLSWAERGVLFDLYLRAAVSADGVTVALPLLAGEAPVAGWKRALGPDGAEAAGRCVQLGLLESVPEGLRATLQGAVHRRAAAVPPSALQGPDGDEPAAAPAARARGAGDPVHALRLAFTRHGLRTAEERGAWLATDPGARTLKRLNLTTEEALDVVARTGVNGGRFGSRTAVSHGAIARQSRGDLDNAATVLSHGDIAAVSPLPPHTPPSEKDKEKEGVDARAPAISHGDIAAVSHGDIETAARQSRAAVSSARDHRAAPHADPLSELQRAAAPHADLMGGGDLEMGASALLIRLRITPAEIPAMALALSRPTSWWPSGGRAAPARATLGDLAGWHTADGYEFKPLSALVAHVRGAARRVPAAPAAPPAPVVPRISPEDVRAMRASLQSPSPPAASPAPAAEGDARVG